MGSNREEITVVYDTGTDWLLSKVHTCVNCGDTGYNYTDEASTSFSEVVPTESDTVYFGSGSDIYIQGNAVLDTVCLIDDEESCAEDFKWLAIEY